MILARLIDQPAVGYGKVGKILIAVVTVAAIVALTIYAPQLGLSVIGTQLVVAVGTVAITLASQYLTNALYRPKSNVDAAKVNVRLEAPPRWINAGLVLHGGGVVFGEFDAKGNLWYLIVHCDSILTGTPQYYLDNELVTLSGSSVTSPNFQFKNKSYFDIWTHTYSETNPVPTGAAELQAAFPSQWDTLSHQLVGTTYTVVRGLAIKLEDRYKVYRWRGPLGLGEPNVAVLGNWSNMYDPRDPSQVLGDRSTYKPSRNNALMWAWWRTHSFGMKKLESEINWQRIAEQADICDQQIVGIESTQRRYECAIAARDDVGRGDVQAQIMLSCDGQLVFDDDGRTWMRAGAYYAPTLNLSRNRDIIAMESVEAQNGESETQGVIVRYVDHNANFTLQPSAPWYNPNYYEAGKGNTFLTVDVPTCYNHNQAMRLAKSIGMRSQPIQKIAPTVSLRGLRAMQERIIGINYDNTFAGDYEIVSPVEVDESGMFCSMALVPMDANRFRLLAGEEKPKPNSTASGGTVEWPLPTGVTVAYNNGRIEARFDAPTRDDVRYEFQLIAQAQVNTGQWVAMTTDMDALFAYSGSVDSSVPQLVRWRTVSSGGAVTAWYDPPYLVNAQVDPSSQAIYNSWIVEAANGQQVTTIAADGTLTITNHTRRYPDGFSDVPVQGATINTGLAAGETRSIAYDDPQRAGGMVTYNLYTEDTDAHVSPDHLYRHYVGYFSVPTTGTGGGGGGGIPGGSGGNCVTDDTPVQMANFDRSGPGMERVAADLAVGDWLWTQHETTMRWGAHQIEALSFADELVYRAAGYPRATAAHRFWTGEWTRMDQIGTEDGTARVARLTVRDAHTYVSAGVLSHNVKQVQ